MKALSLKQITIFLEGESATLRYLKFCSDFFDYVGKRLDEKLRLISQFMTSQKSTNNYNITIARYLEVKATRQ